MPYRDSGRNTIPLLPPQMRLLAKPYPGFHNVTLAYEVDATGGRDAGPER